MKYLQILLCLLLICFTARSQPANLQSTASPPGSSPTNNLSLYLTNLLSLSPALKISAGQEDPAVNKAGIYSTKPVPPLKTLLSSLDPTLKISEGNNGDSTNFICAWPEVTVRFTIRTQWDLPIQRQGMKNWISKISGGDTNTPAVGLLLQKIDGTVACIGSVTTPRYDPTGKASALVLGLANKLDGYIFSEQSFYSSTGEKIIGMTNAPARFHHQL